MFATLDASALKRETRQCSVLYRTDICRLAFTKALTCLSRYGDDLSIYATAETISLSTTNSSKSAYCRFKYTRQFFSKYSVSSPHTYVDEEEEYFVTGQLLTKAGVLNSLLTLQVSTRLPVTSIDSEAQNC